MAEIFRPNSLTRRSSHLSQLFSYFCNDGPRMSRSITGILRRFGWLIGLTIVVSVWAVASLAGLASPRTLPPPHHVLVRLGDDLNSVAVWRSVWTTITAWMTSALAGFALGALIAAWLTVAPAAYRAMQPYLLFANAIPRVVLAPVFILALGLGLANRIALGVSLVVFPVTIGIHGALQLHDSRMVACLQLFGANRLDIWWHVRIPAAAPYLISNWRLASSLGLLGAIAGEILIASSGLGFLLRMRAGIFDVIGVFSVLIMILSLALAVNFLTDLVAARALRWH